MFCKNKMLVIFILVVGMIDLTVSKPSKSCKNPKGKKGDTRTEGCTKYTCTSGKWKEENICSETDLSSLNYCRPACPFFSPFCSGICVHSRLCIGRCVLFKSNIRDCGLTAAQTSSDECKTECSDATDTCQNCLIEKLPDHCADVTYASCFFCAKSVLKAGKQCFKNGTLACVKEHLASASCVGCICSIVCSTLGGDHEFCKFCGDSSDSSIAQYWPSPAAGPQCPPLWVQSTETSDTKCYRVVPGATANDPPTKLSWDQAKSACTSLNGALAIPDNAARHAAVAQAQTQANIKDCWLSGTQEGTSSAWSWVPLLGNPFPVASSDFGPEAECIDFTRPKPSCIYADVNGMACNWPCSVQKCIVCETDPS